MTICAVLAASLTAIVMGQWTPPGPDVAAGRPYTLSPAPNYALCTDPGDATQLTDGDYVQGYFWTQKGTVGWQSSNPITITIDLGRDQAIGGASFYTAAGRAGVHWPLAIDIWVSDDAHAWWHAGDLVALSNAEFGLPPADYAVHRYHTGKPACHGRYVAFQVTSAQDYLFCDEIEVYAGDGASASGARTGRPVADLAKAWSAEQVRRRVVAAIQKDASAIRGEIERSAIPVAKRQVLVATLKSAEDRAADFKMPPEFRAVVPYSDAHAAVLAVRGALWRERGMKASAWPANPWEPMTPADVTPGAARRKSITMTMLRNEERGAVVCMASPEVYPDYLVGLGIRIRGLPSTGGPLISIDGVEWTGTAQGDVVACALEPALPGKGDRSFLAHAGVVSQAWLRVSTEGSKPGRYSGVVEVSDDQGVVARIPLSVRVAKAAMPKRLALSLGGWDYSDTPTYGVTKANLSAFVAFLQRYHVDVPWANASTMGFGKHGADGKMLEPPSTAQMDAWLTRWPNARAYYVFPSFDAGIADTPASRTRLKAWIDFWVGHLRARGVTPDRLGLLLVDEPREPEMDRTIAQAAAVIRAAQPAVAIFEDPIWTDPAQASPDMLQASTVLCPNRVMWMEKRKAYEAVYLPLQASGKRLAFYSCSGPVRSLDPYSYHRLQAWDCFRYGMVHEAFWAFGDNAGVSSWNEFELPRAGFSPPFVSPEGIRSSKHMEAIREGLYDFETLTLLKQAVERAHKAGRNDAVVRKAEALLRDGPARVVGAAPSIWWKDRLDRGMADRVRTEAIGLLERLGGT